MVNKTKIKEEEGSSGWAWEVVSVGESSWPRVLKNCYFVPRTHLWVLFVACFNWCLHWKKLSRAPASNLNIFQYWGLLGKPKGRLSQTDKLLLEASLLVSVYRPQQVNANCQLTSQKPREESNVRYFLPENRKLFIYPRWWFLQSILPQKYLGNEILPPMKWLSILWTIRQVEASGMINLINNETFPIHT